MGEARKVRRPKTADQLESMRYYRVVVLASELGIEDPLSIKPPWQLKIRVGEKLGIEVKRHG